MSKLPLAQRLEDLLTPLGATILQANHDIAYRMLVVKEVNPPAAAEAVATMGKIVSPRELLAAPVRSDADADCVLAGLLLWHDCLDRSHEISQSISSESGSYWHAIMHRREGDF